MMIIDSQVHCYAANTPDRPWAHTPVGWEMPSVTGDQMVVAMDKVGVDGAIYVSPFNLYSYDTSYAMGVQRAHPGRFALVTRVDFDKPDVAEKVAEWKKVPGAVALRLGMPKEQGLAADNPGIDRMLRAVASVDMPMNFLCWGNIDVGTQVIDRHPQTRFVLDHLGMMQPRTKPAPADVWADLPKILELAKRPNVVIKVSGACTMSHQAYPFADIWEPLARVFDAWGFERCLWGTDWTRAAAVVNYEQAVEPFRVTDRLSESERAMLMGGACAKTYGWTPKKG